MRAVLSLLVVSLAVVPATANPRRLEVPRALSRDVREAVPSRALPSLRESGRRGSRATAPVIPRAPAKVERRDLTTPSVWNRLRDTVYDHMPGGGNDRAFSYTLVPMVINGAADSVPGVGLSGSF